MIFIFIESSISSLLHVEVEDDESGSYLNTSPGTGDVNDIQNNVHSLRPMEKGKGKVGNAKIDQLVDNKRRHMERKLSQSQRDKMLLNTAREEVVMKKNLMEVIG